MKATRVWGVILAITTVANAVAQDRTVLTAEQAREFVLQKPFTVMRDTGDRSIRFDFRSDGKVFQNTTRTGASTISSSGSWHVNDENGKVCVEFADPKTRGVCFGLAQEGSVMHLYTGKRSEPEPWGVVK